MKSKKHLFEIFEKAKSKNGQGEYYTGDYYTFVDFLSDAKNFVRDCRNRSTVCSIKPSRSGMSRKFNFKRYNMLLNIVYNGVKFWDYVNVNGCGMDMHWNIKYRVCQALCTPAELKRWNLNYACSSGTIL